MNEKDLKQIEIFFEGQLSQQELSEFDDRLEHDKAFKHLFEVQKVLNGQAIADKKLKERLFAMDAKVGTKNSGQSILRWAASIALMGLLGYLWWFNTEKTLHFGAVAVIEIKQRDHGFTEVRVIDSDSLFVDIKETSEKAYEFKDTHLIIS